MSEALQNTVLIRPGETIDAEEINDLYNWYVDNSDITFDIEPWSVSRRVEWIEHLLQPNNRYHLFVAHNKGDMVGFCYNAVFRPKAAYNSTTEVTIYTRQPGAPRGTGSRLYQSLFAAIGKTTLHRAYAVISQPNAESVRLHKKFDFHHIGTLHEVGTKFGRWIDVAWYEKKLDNHFNQ